MNTIELIQAAIAAPSSHNTQPWQFRVEEKTVELWADRTRALSVNDPYDRELTISCGAALLNLRVAAAAPGMAVTIRLQPDHPDHLATLCLETGEVEAALAGLAPAIRERFSTREAFLDRALPDTLPAALDDAVGREGAKLHQVEDGHRAVLAELIADGDRIQFSNPSWRRELASWMRPRPERDGLAMSPWVAPVSRLVVRSFDMGKKVSQADEDLALEAPALVVISTADDSERSWLCAGQALQRALLFAASAGVQAGYLNQPCQVEQLRGRLADQVCPGRFPQVMLRLGFAERPAHPAPRREIKEVLLD
jgi:hypothetical protein